VLYVHRLLEPVTLVVQHAFWQYVHQWPRWEGWHRELHADDTCRSKSTKTKYSVFHGGWKRLTSNREALPILWPEHYTTENTSPPVDRQSRHVMVSPSTTRTAIGAAFNYATGTATGALTDIGSSPTAAAAPYNAISEVNEVGCTVIYEGEGPLRAE
jgi:hypothetical protein